MSNRSALGRHPRPSRGLAAVEFALIAIPFFMLLIGAMEMGRVLWVFNAASEATRLGARLAVVCPPNKSAGIITRMTGRMGAPTGVTASLTYAPASCTTNTATCTSVTATVSGSVQTFIPAVAFTPSLPSFSTTLSTESMGSISNPDCPA